MMKYLFIIESLRVIAVAMGLNPLYITTANSVLRSCLVSYVFLTTTMKRVRYRIFRMNPMKSFMPYILMET
jgi:hypothetical protein